MKSDKINVTKATTWRAIILPFGSWPHCQRATKPPKSPDKSMETEVEVPRTAATYLQPPTSQRPIPFTELVRTRALRLHLMCSPYYAVNYISKFLNRSRSKHIRDQRRRKAAWQTVVTLKQLRCAYEKTFRPDGQADALRPAEQQLQQECQQLREQLQEKRARVLELPTLVPLTEEHLERYKQLLQGPGKQVLCSKFKLHITRRDLWTLQDQKWLNDQVINFYMSLLAERSQTRSQLPRMHALSSFFALRLLRDGYAAVRRWTRRVDLFSMQLIVMPVHVNNSHWALAVIDMRARAIRYYDSLRQSNSCLLRALVEYLKQESLDKRQLPYNMSAWQLETVKDVPMQTNGYDCGVFLCMYAEYLTREQPLNFGQEDMSYFRKKMLLEICEGHLWL